MSCVENVSCEQIVMQDRHIFAQTAILQSYLGKRIHMFGNKTL